MIVKSLLFLPHITCVSLLRTLSFKYTTTFWDDKIYFRLKKLTFKIRQFRKHIISNKHKIRIQITLKLHFCSHTVYSCVRVIQFSLRTVSLFRSQPEKRGWFSLNAWARFKNICQTNFLWCCVMHITTIKLLHCNIFIYMENGLSLYTQPTIYFLYYKKGKCLFRYEYKITNETMWKVN